MKIVKASVEKIKDSQELVQKLEHTIIEIHDDPVMESVLDVMSILGKHKEITIKARGQSISNAVTVALIITEKMMNKNSKISKITVDTDPIHEMGSIQSTIKIILKKI